MSIYTKTGDNGETSLFGGKRIPKYDDQVEVYGSIDELTSFIGLTLSKITKKTDQELLTDIQTELYQIMSILAGYEEMHIDLKSNITRFEKYIDSVTAQLPELNRFILPQGGEVSASFHVLRTITRRVERLTARFFHSKHLLSPDAQSYMMTYLNRLSDLFFIMARKYTEEKEIAVFQGKRVK
ncbi:cob(I)yrinic acid a,c-diamide adenosyltransferase [Candidatus Roizmanbacteria bacterium]|nr:cob(I)yrinic acid a,c-diamide adenosyltransferase [Candidatus Roizmanbacteria bacterium]